MNISVTRSARGRTSGVVDNFYISCQGKQIKEGSEKRKCSCCNGMNIDLIMARRDSNLVFSFSSQSGGIDEQKRTSGELQKFDRALKTVAFVSQGIVCLHSAIARQQGYHNRDSVRSCDYIGRAEASSDTISSPTKIVRRRSKETKCLPVWIPSF